MNEDLDNIQFRPILDINYSKWFAPVEYNGNILSPKERRNYVSLIDGYISLLSGGIPIYHDAIERSKNQEDDLQKIEHTLNSVMLFVLITILDDMTISKLFVASGNDYERRFLRGKMAVILNEGFKRLYGFKGKTRTDSQWSRLQPIIQHFPEKIRIQYAEISQKLEELSKESWWQDVRCQETHIDAEALYYSRQEEIIESKVVMESQKLFRVLMAVSDFLSNMHVCIHNLYVSKYRKGELSEE